MTTVNFDPAKLLTVHSQAQDYIDFIEKLEADMVRLREFALAQIEEQRKEANKWFFKHQLLVGRFNDVCARLKYYDDVRKERRK